MPRVLAFVPSGEQRKQLLEKYQIQDVLDFDPAQAENGASSRVCHLKGDVIQDWAFIGSNSVIKNPIPLLEFASRKSHELQSFIAFGFPFKSVPVVRSVALSLSRILKVEEVLVGENSELMNQPWPVGAMLVGEVTEPISIVGEAQRRARWLELIEDSTEFEIDLSEVGIEFARLGSPEKLKTENSHEYVLKNGSQIFLISDHETTDLEVGTILNKFEGSKLVQISPQKYQGLVCSFAKQNGEDYALGIIQEFDVQRGVMKILSKATAGSKPKILRIGTLKIGESGQESEAIAPWTV